MKNRILYLIPVLIFLIGIYFFAKGITNIKRFDRYFQTIELTSNTIPKDEIKLEKQVYQIYLESKKLYLYDVDSLEIELRLFNDEDSLTLRLPSDSLKMKSTYTIEDREGLLIGNIDTVSLSPGKYQGVVISDNRFDKTASITITPPFMMNFFMQIVGGLGILFITFALTIISIVIIVFVLKKKKKKPLPVSK